MPEKKYIDREEILKYPIRLDHYDKKHGNAHFVYGVESVIEFIKDLPTVDVAEVVRCRDCKFRKTEDCAMHYECECGQQNSWETDNDFCSFGKRRMTKDE